MNTAESEMGLAKGYISKLGNSNPNQKTLQKMSEYFGVSVEYLINGKEEDSEQKITSLSKSEMVYAGRNENRGRKTADCSHTFKNT